MLSDDVLLNIFRHYLSTTPQSWTTLSNVCQKWKQIVLTSPHSLNLRLYCTSGTAVHKALDLWPEFPIILQYGGFSNRDPPTPKDDHNIIAALKQSSRVSSLFLTVTSSLLGKLSAISEPFSELYELAVLSQDNVSLVLPSAFQWGTRLRVLHSTRIAFPLFPQLLSPCQDLTDLQLHEIPGDGYFSPEALANALSGKTQLHSLKLHLLSFPRRRSHLALPPPSGERIVLPALAYLKYRGTSKYLDSFVSRIDAPRLGNMDITFFNQPTIDASELGRFIERIETQASESHIKADVETSSHAVSVSFTNSDTSTPLRLQISCKQLDWQLSCMAQVCAQFSPFLSRVSNLGINTADPSSVQDGVGEEQWLALICAFSGAEDFRVAGVLVTDILSAFRLVNGADTAVLPSLLKIRVDSETPMTMHGPSWDVVQSFITSRRLSSQRHVQLEVYAQEYSCHICAFGFITQERLKTHLGDKHGYRTMCSYCRHFECTPENKHRFQGHLENEHPEVARNDPICSNPDLIRLSFLLETLVKRHSSLRAPDILAPPATAVAAQSQIPITRDSDTDNIPA